MEDIIFSAKQVQGKKALFGKGRFALQNVDFELPSGYIMGIIGENGAGKTTFFRYIMEEKKHYRGSFYLDGTDIAEDHAWSMNRIGFVSEERLFLRQKSARENARMLGSFYDTFDMDQFAALMEQMDLTTARTVEKMSRGENMKFQLAFALAHKPRLLLLDEPTAGMDPIFRKEFYRLLRQQLEVLYMYTLSGAASSSSLQLLVRHTHTSVSRSSRCFFMLGFFRLNDFFGSVSINKTTFGGRMPVGPAIFFTFFLHGRCFARWSRSEPWWTGWKP